jgi:hypothetical protein
MLALTLLLVLPTPTQAARKLPGPPNIIKLGKALQKQGLSVSEHPSFGGVCRCHSPNSRHYSGRAIDVNWYGRNERGKLNSLARKLRARGWNVLWLVQGHYDHLHADY